MAESKSNLKPISFRLPADLLDQARKLSAETGVSISFVVRKAIEAWVNEGLSKINKPS